jgi:hypothetical protein
MAAGALDAQGVWQYGEDDPLSPFSTFLNLLAASVSASLAAKAGGMLANGYLALAANSSVNATTSITVTPVDVTGFQVSVTVPAGRRIKITFDGQLWTNTANDQGQVGIREGSTLLTYTNGQIMPVTSRGYGAHCECVLTPTAGTHVYKISIGRQAGAGLVNLIGQPNSPSFIAVEDVGPAR